MSERAFPVHAINEYGMTLRDYFAAKALQGMMGNPTGNPMLNPAVNCEICYIMADAMLKAREEVR